MDPLTAPTAPFCRRKRGPRQPGAAPIQDTLPAPSSLLKAQPLHSTSTLSAVHILSMPAAHTLLPTKRTLSRSLPTSYVGPRSTNRPPKQGADDVGNHRSSFQDMLGSRPCFYPASTYGSAEVTKRSFETQEPALPGARPKNRRPQSADAVLCGAVGGNRSLLKSRMLATAANNLRHQQQSLVVVPSKVNYQELLSQQREMHLRLSESDLQYRKLIAALDEPAQPGAGQPGVQPDSIFKTEGVGHLLDDVLVPAAHAPV